MKKILEICCFNPEAAILASSAGADRIEFCDNIYDGGTTPSYGAIAYVQKNIEAQMNVIVRPRGGDFCYSKAEFEIIKQDIRIVKELGADGVVVGILNENLEVDIERNLELVELARPMSVTFHRAFDLVKNSEKALEDVIKTGADRILTSGCKSTAYVGLQNLQKIIKQANQRIIIMPGAGINENNLKEIVEKTQTWEFHSSAKIFVKSDYQTSENVGLQDIKNNSIGYFLPDKNKIVAMKKILENLD